MKRHLIFAALCLLAGGAHAEKADSTKETVILAELVEFDDVNQTQVLTGNVELRRGTLVMLAEKATIRETPDGWQVATLFGGRGKAATFRQKRDGGADLWVEGRAERIEYDQRNELVKMFEKANIKQLDGRRVTDELESEFISYDSRKEFFVAHNDSTGGAQRTGKGRVRMVLGPPKSAPAPATPAAERK